MRFAMRLYRALARAFPHEFKVVYGADVIQLGEDVVQNIAKEHGLAGLFRLVIDIAVRVPIEYLSEMRRDFTYALRTLAKARGFAAVGIVSLGLGIGVTAVATSELLNLVLRDAPGASDPDRLALVSGVSYPYVEHYRDHRDLFSGAAAFQTAVPYNIAIGDAASAKASRVFGQLVSPEYFHVVGVNAARGRVFSPEADKPGEAPVVFISDRFWRERMNSDAGAVGRTIRVNGQTATIAGIGPRNFLGMIPFISADIFVPTTASSSMAPELAGDVIHQREAKSFTALLRLAPGVSWMSAEAGLDAITRNLDKETLDPARNAKGRRIMLLPGGKILPLPRTFVPLTLAFMTMLNGLIIAVACMNLANMQLARATARRKEVAIRLSVGASRFRLIRQLLTESTLLAMGGGAAGILLAYWVASLLRKASMPFPFPVNFDITPDWRVIGIVFGISFVAGIGFGLAPALAETRADLASTLKQGLAGEMRIYRRFGIRNLLMVGQLAGSLALLLVAGFMVIGFQKTYKIEIAFDPTTMYLMSLDPVRDGYPADKASRFFDNLGQRLKRAPGVREVALAHEAPFAPQAAAFTLSAPGASGAPDQVVSAVAKTTVGPRYFAALSVPVLHGREFDTRDQHADAGKGQALPVVINETAAHAFFGANEPVGRRIADAGKSYEVIGVVKDLSAPMSQTGQGQSHVAVPFVYLPLTKTEFARSRANGIVVMVRSDRADAMDSVRRELASVDRNVAVFNVRTLASQVSDTLAYLRMGEFFYGGIGAFGLVLASIGLAGVTAYSVARRRKEIGIRMALGARKEQAVGLILREGGSLVLAGSVLGLGGAILLSRVISAFSSMLGPSFQAGARDPRLIFGAPLLLAALAMLACWVPARRTAKIDPLIALREE